MNNRIEKWEGLSVRKPFPNYKNQFLTKEVILYI